MTAPQPSAEQGPGEAPIAVPLGRSARLRRLIRPLRRFAAWFALVNEEREGRRWEDIRLDQRIEERGHWIEDLERRFAWVHDKLDVVLADVASSVEETKKLRHEVDAGVGARADLTLQELWRRLEGADARQAAAIQRLADEVSRLRAENERLLRELGAPETGAGGSGDRPVSQNPI